MKTQELIMLRHFLKALEEMVEIEKLQEPIAPAFVHLLTREDLKQILISLYGDEKELEKAHPNYYCVSIEVLLFEYIRDEFYILKYFNDVVIPKYLL